MPTTTHPYRFSVTEALRANRLGTSSLVFFAIAAAAPLAVVAGGISAAYADTTFPAVPAAYLVMGIVLLVWSVGYTTLARHVVTAGSLYAYVARGLGSAAGLCAAAIALIAYPVTHIGLAAGFGAILAQILAGTGMHVPWIGCAFVGWAAIAVLGTRKIDLSGWVLGVLLTAQVLIVVGYDLVLLAHPHDGRLDLSTLSPVQVIASPDGLITLVGVIASFTGIELPTVLGEEAKDPRRTVGRATRLAVMIICCLYTVSAWALPVATGSADIHAVAQEHGPQLVFALAAEYLPAIAIQAGQLFLLTSIFAAALAFHSTAARYLFALGREGVLPGWLGKTSRRSGVPARASFVHSTAALTVLVAYALTGLDDPLTHMLFWGTLAGGFGVLILMTATSFSVVRHFAGPRHAGESLWSRRIAPTVSGLLLAAVLVTSVAQIPTFFGIDSHSATRWIMPGAYLAGVTVALSWAVHLKRVRPEVMAQVGNGDDEPGIARRGLTTTRAEEVRRKRPGAHRSPHPRDQPTP